MVIHDIVSSIIPYLSCAEKAPQGRSHVEPVLCRGEGGDSTEVERFQPITAAVYNSVGTCHNTEPITAAQLRRGRGKQPKGEKRKQKPRTSS